MQLALKPSKLSVDLKFKEKYAPYSVYYPIELTQSWIKENYMLVFEFWGNLRKQSQKAINDKPDIKEHECIQNKLYGRPHAAKQTTHLDVKSETLVMFINNSPVIA